MLQEALLQWESLGGELGQDLECSLEEDGGGEEGDDVLEVGGEGVLEWQLVVIREEQVDQHSQQGTQGALVLWLVGA